MNSEKVWLITGCSTGFGWELTKYVAGRGEQVVATVRKENQIAEIESLAPDKIKCILMDVQHLDQINQGVAFIKEEFGRLDVLVNNAGYGEIGPVEEISDEAMQRQFDVNVFGPIRLMRAALPIMREQRAGRIINISSIAGLRGAAGLGIYNSSKFALEGVGEALAREVAHLGIFVTNVEPGPFRTKWAGASATYTTTIHEDYEKTAGAFMEVLKGKDGNQPGDPVKGAEAIYRLTKIENPPVRLPLGNFAFEAALQQMADISEEIKSFEHLGRPTDYE